jgi:type 1 glutamine amidotransferase
MRKILNLLFIAAITCAVSAQDAKPLRVLHLTGGCCHDYDKQKIILSEGITARANTTFDIVHEGGKSGDYKYPLLQAAGWGKNFDVVLYNICFAHIKDDAYVEGITRVHHEGLPAVALHCTYHSHHWKTKTDEWEKFLGVTSPNHGRKHAITMKNLAPKHPIMKNFPAEWTTPEGELYRENKTWDTATPLVLGTAGEEKHHCVWINQYGAARVFGTTVGHHNSTMESKEYLDLVSAGLLWVTGKLGDDGNPVKGYGPKN